MDHLSDRPPDPLDHLLAPPPLPEDGAALREELFNRTAAVLRRQRRLHALAVAGALAACYGAGLLTMRWAMTPAGPPAPGQVAGLTGGPPRPPTPVAPPADPSPAVVLEERAADSADRQAGLYRQAGDRYLEGENDPSGALRCYGNSLDAGADKDLTISPTDNWLLMAIKDARQKERRDAKKGG